MRFRKVQLEIQIEDEQLPALIEALKPFLKPGNVKTKRRISMEEIALESFFPDFPSDVHQRHHWFRSRGFCSTVSRAGWTLAREGLTPIDLLLISKEQFLELPHCGLVGWQKVVEFREANKDKLFRVESMGLTSY